MVGIAVRTDDDAEPPAATLVNGDFSNGVAGWQLGWWVGAEDRWHQPEHEVADGA